MMLVHLQNAFDAINCTILLHKPNPNGFSDCAIVLWVSVAFFLISTLTLCFSKKIIMNLLPES